MSQEFKLPGEKIAFLEEYLSGENTFDDGESIRSTMIGEAKFDKSERIASIQNKKSVPIPKIGDEIIGIVEASLGSLIAVSMQYINGNPINSNVECICTTRHMRRKNVALVKDIIKLKIINRINGTIHASMDEPNFGVLFTKCRKCFGEVIQNKDAVKCKDCGWFDDRKLSSDFGKADFLK
jgi:exosome complex component CSL4